MIGKKDTGTCLETLNFKETTIFVAGAYIRAVN